MSADVQALASEHYSRGVSPGHRNVRFQVNRLADMKPCRPSPWRPSPVPRPPSPSPGPQRQAPAAEPRPPRPGPRLRPCPVPGRESRHSGNPRQNLATGTSKSTKPGPHSRGPGSGCVVPDDGFEPSKAKADGFTVRSLWPLGQSGAHLVWCESNATPGHRGNYKSTAHQLFSEPVSPAHPLPGDVGRVSAGLRRRIEAPSVQYARGPATDGQAPAAAALTREQSLVSLTRDQ